MNREAYRTSALSEGGEEGELFHAVHVSIGAALNSISWTLEGSGNAVGRHRHISHDTLNRLLKEIPECELRDLIRRAGEIEAYLTTRNIHSNDPMASMPAPDDDEVRRVFSFALHLLSSEDEKGRQGRKAIERALEVLELGAPLPDRTLLLSSARSRSDGLGKI